MKHKFVGAGIALLGIFLACYEGSMLAYQRSFTETAEGTVIGRSGDEVIVQFHAATFSAGPNKIQQSADAQCAFPLNERTANLKAGDTIRAYYPPGKLPEIRLDRDFTTWIPVAAAILGGVLALAGAAIAWFSDRGIGNP